MQVNMPAARRLAQIPENYADGGAVGFGARGLSQLRELVPKMAAMGFPQQAQAPAPAPVSDPRAAQLMAMIPQMEAMGFKQKPQMLARGGMVRGPGTGTSDSIPDQAEPGTYIMPADSTAAIGPSALEKMGTVPVRLSDGEMKLPPEQVMAIGEAVLKLMKDATHTPVNGEDGGQTDAEVDDDDGARGFNPADRMAQMPQMYADGGMVDPNRPNSFGDAAAVTRDPGVTQVDSGYQPGNGTVSVVPSQPVAPPAPTRPPNTVVSMINPEWDRVAKQQNAAAPAPSAPATPAAATPAAPTPPAQMGWAERNNQRNLQVTASSIMDSPERRAAQAALAPPPPPAPVAPPPAAPAPITSGFQSASQRLGTLSSVGQPRTGYQPRRYADGGMVEDRAVFGFYPQLTDHGKTTRATADQLRQGVQAAGPASFQPAAPAAEPPPLPAAQRMSNLTDPRSLSFAGTQAQPEPAPAPSGALSRATTMMSTQPSPAPLPSGSISSQNMSAANTLARRGAADALADMPNAPAPVQAPTVRHSGNDWAARNALRNAEVSASSIMNNGGRWDRTGGRNPAALAYQQALATDNALQASEPGLAAAAMKENSETSRAAMQERSATSLAQAGQSGALERTLIGERGANSRAGLAALAGLEEARLKAGAGKPLNDVQSKALQFGTRMQTAGQALDKLASQGVDQPGLIKRGADAIGLGAAANWTQSGGQQQVEQAQRDFVNAVLRRESGAAISDGEFSNARQQYFPQVGDSPEVIAQKRKNREIATSGVLAEVPDSDRRVNEVVARADANTPPAAQPGARGPVPEDVGALLKKYGG